MTKSSRQAAIAGYLKRDDGVDWKGLTDYANSMYDVRDELEIADVEIILIPRQLKRQSRAKLRT